MRRHPCRRSPPGPLADAGFRLLERPLRIRSATVSLGVDSSTRKLGGRDGVLVGPPAFLTLSAPSLLSGTPGVWAGLAVIIIFGEIRTHFRRQIQIAMWPEIGRTKIEFRRWSADRLARPVWWLAHALCAAAAPLSRTIDWAGIRYQVNGPQSVTVERRSNGRLV
jgi:hypothetical protein